MCSQIFTGRLKAFIFIIDWFRFCTIQASSSRGWNSPSVKWWYFWVLSVSFPLGTLHEPPVAVDRAWSISVIHSWCILPCNTPLTQRQESQGAFCAYDSPCSPWWIFCPKDCITEASFVARSWNRIWVHLCKWWRKKRPIFVLVHMDISGVIQWGHVQKARLGKTNLWESFRFKI